MTDRRFWLRAPTRTPAADWPAWLLLAALSGCSTFGSHPPHAVSLSGNWHLDESLSDDPRAAMRAQMDGGRHRQSMRGADDADSDGQNARGARARGGDHWRPRQESEWLAHPMSISIDQQPQVLRMIADGVHTDFDYGQEVIASVRGGTAERRAGWRGQQFVVGYRITNGGSAKRSYELADGGTHLVIITYADDGWGPKIKFRSVYERRVEP